MHSVRKVSASFLLLLALGSHPALYAEAPNNQASKPLRIYDRVQVVTIGINETFDDNEGRKNDRIPALKAAESDAMAVHKLLQEDYGYECLPPLLGSAATKERIQQTLQDTMAGLGVNDALIVFIACHGKSVKRPGGGDAGFIVPSVASLSLDEADIKIWEEKAIPISTLTSLLQRANGDTGEEPRGKHVVLILDTCCSGFATRRGGPAKVTEDQLILASAPSRKVIAATSEFRPSLEDLDSGYGVFTKSFLAELGKKRASNLTELFEAVRSKVLVESKAVMRPQMGAFGEGEGEFVFIPKRSTVDKAKMEREFRDAVRRFSLRGALLTTGDDVIAAFQAQDYRYSVDRRQEKEADWERRLKRFEENAALSDPLAFAGLHYCYSKGLGVERTEKTRAELDQKAYQAAVQANELGHVCGKHVLARCLLEGIGAQRNVIAARRLIKEAASADFPLSCFSMGRLIITAKPPESFTQEDIAMAIDWFEKAAKGGVISAKVAQSHLYAGTLPAIKADIPKAIELLSSAAASGNAEAKYLLSEIYSLDRPGFPPKNLERAAQLLEDAASEGWAAAQNKLGTEYAGSGYFVPAKLGTFNQDFGLARGWFELSAAQGNSFARKNICRMHEDGEGGPVNLVVARALCESAAEDNSAWAFVKKGTWYYNGTVYAQDHDLAVHNYRIAAEMRDPEGCYFLGEMYWRAQGVEPTTIAKLRAAGLTAQQITATFHPTALFWFIRAEMYGGDSRATARLKEFHRYYECLDESGNQALYILTRNANPPIDYEHFRPNDIVETFRRNYENTNVAEYQRLLELLGRQVKAAPLPLNPNRVSGIEGGVAGEKRVLANRITFCWCPPGKYLMGPSGAADNESSVEVTLTSGFWLGETELTQGQWQQLMESNPWNGQPHVREGIDSPAVYVRHGDAVSFCEKMTAQEKRAGHLPNGWKYSLPTEAQWEYACRAGRATVFSFGDDESQLGKYGWFSGNASDHPERVGQKRANDWGLRDMHGNVCEWCADWYWEPLRGGQNPSGPSSLELSNLLRDQMEEDFGFNFQVPSARKPSVRSGGRVFRGGAWDCGANRCRSAYRNADEAVVRYYFVGFRLALVPE